MKKIIITLSAFVLSFTAYAQDPNVLIGISAPVYGVKIKANFPGVTGAWARGYYVVNQDNSNNFLGFGVLGSANNGIAGMDYGWIGKDYNQPYMSFLPNGNVGIGITSPTDKFQVEGNQISLRNSTTNNGIIFNVNAFGHPAIIPTNGTGTQDKNLLLAPFGGNVGIGTTTPNEKLAVNGKIRAKEIKVEVANWPDYVFEAGYKFGTLEELESYIKTNKHLPGMPTAKEIETNGLELGEMVKLQQQKIEELTLHLVEKNRELSQEKEKNQSQEERITRLEKLLKIKP